jgi:hypothetical protein
VSVRPRGFAANWKPQPHTRALLDIVVGVLTEYAEQLPLTIRQIFYRLVGRHDYEKTERAYKNLAELLNKARRAKLVPMAAIRDDGFTRQALTSFLGVDEFLSGISAAAHELVLNRQQGPSRREVLWCEATGMVPQLERIANPCGIEVCSSGGFDSTTDKHVIAEEWANNLQPTTVLHLGDHDPSGIHCFSSLAADITAFAEHYGGDVEFVRLAVTLEQAKRFGLPSAPPKASDRRSFTGDETYQAEALDPRDLANIVRSAIEARFDRGHYETVLVEEVEARQGVLSRLGLGGEDE